MSSTREPRPEWLLAIRAIAGQAADLRFNSEVGRWEFRFLEADGAIRSQFFGWFKNPLTGERIPGDPVTGLPPFRDLDEQAIREVCASLEATYIGNPLDGEGTTLRRVRARQLHNERVRTKFYREQGALFADYLSEARHGPQVAVLSDLSAPPTTAASPGGAT